MNPKVTQMIEKHVEKIVLAVAAAGALYLGYLALQPVTLEGHDDVPVSQVEARVSELIEKMKQSEEINKGLDIKAPKPEYASKYERLIKTKPLTDELLNAAVPRFGPVNEGVRAGGIAVEGAQPMKVVTPMPVPPENVTADVWQQQVAAVPLPAPGAPAPIPTTPGAALPMRDQNAVVVQGYIPVAKMLAEMNSQKIQANAANNTRLPDGLRRVSIYRIEIERRERTGTGWTDFKSVPISKGSTPPTDIPWQAIPDDQTELQSRMDQVDLEFKQIVIPDFYLDSQGLPLSPPILTRPLTKPLQERIKQLQDALNTSMNITTPAGAAGSAFAPAPTETPETPAPAGMTADVTTLRAQPLIPFSVWDETVEAGHQYQYRARIAFVNPTFNWQHGLAKPEMKSKPLLYSDYVTVSTPVTVNPDVAFFVMGPGINAKAVQHVSVRVFKRTGGKWYWNEFDSQPGMGIAGQVSLVDQGDRRIDVDTGYTVVDVVSNGNDAHVVLVDGTGALSTRDSTADRNDDQNKKLMESVTKHPVATAPAPTTRSGSGRGMPGRGPAAPLE